MIIFYPYVKHMVVVLMHGHGEKDGVIEKQEQDIKNEFKKNESN